jgi:glycosyltransferase involved in cell wall biosynthesis
MSAMVSILIPCFNAEAWIDQAVRSAVEQTWQDCEIIVIDDGSTDRSPALLEQWRDAATIILRGNRGGNPTRNELLQQASGEWVQFLDADDYLLPGKVQTQMELLAANPAVRMFYSPLIIEHRRIGDVQREEWNPHDPQGDHDPWAYHLGWKLTQTGGALFHRQTLIDAGGWDDQQPCCQDNEVFFRMLQTGEQCMRSPVAEAVYRRFDGGSVSTGNEPQLVDEILRILDAGEQFLRTHDMLTARRLQAANQTRFDIARKAWNHNRDRASAIMDRIKQGDRNFVPSPGPEAPGSYRLAYRLFGFNGAERLANLKRKAQS